jgi:hypothetical protein
MRRDDTVVPLAEIERHILTLRGQKVMLDGDLADLCGVPTKRLNEQVRRNLGRFPPDFMFQLSAEEASALRSQIATSKPGRGGRRYPPYAFTEHVAIMLAKAIRSLVQTIRQLMAPAEKPRRSIGFKVEEGRPVYRRPRRRNAR